MKIKSWYAVILLGLFTVTATAQDYTFQEGISGYSDTVTVQINAGLPNTSTLSTDASDDSLSADADNGEFGSDETQVLLRFDGIVGGGAIPPGSVIASASLRVWTVSSADGPVTVGPLDQTFTTSSTWNSMGGGATTTSNDDALSSIGGDAFTIFDVTNSVQAIVGGGSNNGWAFTNADADGWDFCSELPTCESSPVINDRRPLLTVRLVESLVPVPVLGGTGLLILSLFLPLVAYFGLRRRRKGGNSI